MKILDIGHKQQVSAVAVEQSVQFCRENILRNDRHCMTAVRRKRCLHIRADLLFAALVQIHIAVCRAEQIVDQKVMVRVADLPADCVAERELCTAVVLLDQTV